MATVEDKDASAVKRREKVQEALFKALARKDAHRREPVGLAYAIDGKVREVRVFTHPAIFKRFAETLVGTVAMETDLSYRQAKIAKKKVYKKAAAASKVAKMVKGAEKLSGKKKKTKAGNVNRLRKSADVFNSDCFDDGSAKAPVTRSFMNAH